MCVLGKAYQKKLEEGRASSTQGGRGLFGRLETLSSPFACACVWGGVLGLSFSCPYCFWQTSLSLSPFSFPRLFHRSFSPPPPPIALTLLQSPAAVGFFFSALLARPRRLRFPPPKGEKCLLPSFLPSSSF